MNRLTVRVSDGIEFKPKVYKWDIKKRLAEYEDTGLKPDEIPQLQEKYDTAIKALSGAILEKAEIPQWIPVSERLPEESDGDENGEVLIRKDGEDWITKVPWVKEEGATYWHRLPQPPKGENNEH